MRNRFKFIFLSLFGSLVFVPTIFALDDGPSCESYLQITQNLKPLKQGDNPFIAGLKKILGPEQSRQLDTIHTIWNTSEFDVPRLPITVGTIQDQARFSKQNGIRVESMPIKMLRTNVRVPAAYAQFNETISLVVGFERSINPHFDDYYMYITINQGPIQTGKTQRRPGAHSDGFQENYFNQQDLVDRNYLISDALPTEFFNQPFPISHLTDARQVLPYFDSLVDPSKMVTYPAYTITEMDTYTVHRPSVASAEVKYRTFVKVVFSPFKFNRQGNTHNDLFDYHWLMVPRGADRNSTNTTPATAPVEAQGFRAKGCSGNCMECGSCP